ncbi:hypothetical protein [Rhodopirellula europaea]|uniref:hypothetical protein n=1 Tax=Rhodopirellula europaea TaxID=1263866 RepID=UPI003D2D3E46
MSRLFWVADALIAASFFGVLVYCQSRDSRGFKAFDVNSKQLMFQTREDLPPAYNSGGEIDLDAWTTLTSESRSNDSEHCLHPATAASAM